jgi:quinol monooxygenase YgiN
MDRYGMFGKILAKEGQRDALLEILLEASRTPMKGCEIYIVSKSPTEPDAIWVMEVWQTEADHAASLKLDSVKALLNKARRIMAGGGTESILMVPVGGKGLAPSSGGN